MDKPCQAKKEKAEIEARYLRERYEGGSSARGKKYINLTIPIQL